AGLSAFQNEKLNLSGTGEPVRIAAARVSANLFSMLGVSPIAGRDFASAEDAPGHAVTILSYGLWQGHFGGDPGVIGRSVVLEGKTYRIIGVMPRTFEFPPRGTPDYEPAELWVPIAFAPEQLADLGDNFDIGVLAELRPGVTLKQARADMS